MKKAIVYRSSCSSRSRPSCPITQAKGDDFNDVVKLIEQFYHVKHQGIPFLARAGIKTATTVARISGGRRRQIAEAGSVKVAYFEDQDFRSERRLCAVQIGDGCGAGRGLESVNSSCVAQRPGTDLHLSARCRRKVQRVGGNASRRERRASFR